ncbi:MAG: Manganese transport system membrane protein MntB [Chlamydiae bacterium]|nr:Manganese transport system membrane protein MntB [Chlamydiota bacterium]
MCFLSGLIGCLVFLQKRSLVGEALSHAAYPGVVLSAFFAAFLLPSSEGGGAALILLGAFVFGMLGLLSIDALEKKLKISSDAALCFVLSIFFGVGVLVASRMQTIFPLGFRKIQIFLFGQAATMLDHHVILYGFLALLGLAVVVVLFRSLETLYFDPHFAKVVGVKTGKIHLVTYLLLVLAIVIGMRSVGVVLMSAMFIAPPAAARQWTRRLGPFFVVSSLFGLASGFLGNVLSYEIPGWMGQPRLSLPTGPMIVLSATFFTLFSLFFAPERGMVTRMIRAAQFRRRCAWENILKALCENKPIGTTAHHIRQMQRKGWVNVTDGELSLTEEGKERGEKLVRLHRLWEAYLIFMGQERERVHYSAEEMEHILTPEVEKELAGLLEKESTS